jgi:GNAT superfamily N-acetyltransferase
MHIVLEEELKRVTSIHKPFLFALYREAFSKFDENLTMSSWVTNLKSHGLFHYNELIAGLTLNRFVIEKETCYQVLLLGVLKKHRGKGKGSKLMKSLMEKTSNIVLWSDKRIVGFYLKLGFRESRDINKLVEQFVKYEADSVFLYWGFKVFLGEKEEEASEWGSSDDRLWGIK